MAPIDPLQLLNALGNLLSSTGGIKSIENVHKIASLMMKFSKKLVSRCIYCSVLKETTPEVLNAFLDQEGWFTVNLWLADAKETENMPFLIEMLELCRVLPMTLERLKENNTAKLAKSLCKSSNETVKKLAVEVVTKWMKIIKLGSAVEKPVEKVKKKRKKEKVKDGKPEKDVNSLKEETNLKNESKDGDPVKKSDDDEDDDDDTDDKEAEMAESAAKIKEPRPKTVKTFQTKFRSTGLIEETPLPKAVVKKTGVLDRNAVAAAKNAVKRSHPNLPFFPEKKIKPSSLITTTDQFNNSGPGIKLIAAKPKPVHILHESAGFMDALVSAPVQVRKRKKSQSKGGTPTSPTTPPSTTPPKLQFYKDTLEMNETESTESSQGSEESQKKEKKDSGEEEPMETDQEEKKEGDEKMDTEEENSSTGDSNVEGVTKGIRSILSQVKKRDKKKTVKWAEESNLKEFFYFEMDETERVNVNNMKNFGDMKTLEMKREREAVETCKRFAKGDKMTESTAWTRLQKIDIPPPIVEPGCNSTEKELQLLHQKTTLQEIYFSRDMIPDAPHEAETEQHEPQEPQIIPLEDISNPGQLVDYSMMDLPAPKASLPPVLTNLMMSITGQGGFPPLLEDSQDMMPQLSNNMPMLGMDHPQTGMMVPPPNHFEGPNQEQFLGPPPNAEGWGEWGGPEMKGLGPMMDNNFYPQDMNNMPPMGVHHQRMGHPMQGGPRHPMQHGMMRPGMDMMHRGMHPRGHMGPMRGRSPRVPCRHFMTSSCRFGASCNFLHPGINGPML